MKTQAFNITTFVTTFVAIGLLAALTAQPALVSAVPFGQDTAVGQSSNADPAIHAVLAQGAFRSTLAAANATATYTIGVGIYGETIVSIGGNGALVTLPDIQQALNALMPGTELLTLQDAPNKVWMAHANILIEQGVTLTLNTETVKWLQLRSQDTDIATTRNRSRG